MPLDYNFFLFYLLCFVLFAFSSRTDKTYLHLSLTLPFSVYLMQWWMLIAAINVEMPCSSQSNRYGFRIGMVQILHASDFPEFPCGKFQKFRLFTASKSTIYHQSHIRNAAGLIEPIMMKLFILKEQGQFVYIQLSVQLDWCVAFMFWLIRPAHSELMISCYK